jgi:hypothetical protein
VILILIVVGLAVVVGSVAGGSLRPFQDVRFRWWGAAIAGLALQGVLLTTSIDRRAGFALLLVSYVLLLAFVWRNRDLPALWLAMAGLVLNVLVIAVNGGMPVSAAALDVAGASAEGLASGETAKHHLMGPGDSLTPLGDVIGIPPPIGAVVSVGDLFLYAGVAALVVTVMLGRSGAGRRPPPRWFEGYRGKHLPPERRFARRRRAPAVPVGEEQWET